jgi:hypothetical protein
MALIAASCWAPGAPSPGNSGVRPTAPTDAEVPAALRPHVGAIKERFAQGMELSVDPQTIVVTGAEVLANDSYIVYLLVPGPGDARLAAVFGHCVEPSELGYAGGFVTGPADPELVAQREAAQMPCT